jgi:hypothetical protein
MQCMLVILYRCLCFCLSRLVRPANDIRRQTLHLQRTRHIELYTEATEIYIDQCLSAHMYRALHRGHRNLHWPLFVCSHVSSFTQRPQKSTLTFVCLLACIELYTEVTEIYTDHCVSAHMCVLNDVYIKWENLFSRCLKAV